VSLQKRLFHSVKSNSWGLVSGSRPFGNTLGQCCSSIAKGSTSMVDRNKNLTCKDPLSQYSSSSQVSSICFPVLCNALSDRTEQSSLMSASVPWFEGGREPVTMLCRSAKGSLRTYTQQTYILMINENISDEKTSHIAVLSLATNGASQRELAAV